MKQIFMFLLSLFIGLIFVIVKSLTQPILTRIGILQQVKIINIAVLQNRIQKYTGMGKRLK
jgi:hypothetical protein